jgi:hypothetical protein
MARKLAASTVVTNPNTGAPTVIEAGAEVPEWAEGLLEDHLFEADTPREVAEDADVDDNAKPAVALAEEAGTVAVGVNPTQVEPADAGVGFATAPGPDTVSAPVDEEREPGEPRGDEGPAEQAAVGGSPAEEPKKTAARRRKAADKGDNQSPDQSE